MLSKTKRLSRKMFTQVMEKGQVFHCPFFLLRVGLGDGPTRFGVSVPKKVAKTAVSRNKLRRRVYSAIGRMYNSVDSDRLVVVVVKVDTKNLDYGTLASELEKIFVKSGIIE